MNTYKNPTWWTQENDSAWEKTKAAMKRDWDQTKHDMGGKQPDTDQNVNHTVKQAAGSESIPPRGERVYDEVEPALRFGHGARKYYGTKYPKWNPELEKELRRDWRTSAPEADWDEDLVYVKTGWNYGK